MAEGEEWMKPLSDNVTRFELRIPLTLLESIDANGGKHNRSAWIREAIENRLTKEREIIMPTQPMRIHKRIVIQVLRAHPEDLTKLAPEWSGTAQEFIRELESRPGQYFIGGVLEEPVETSTK